MGETRDEVRFLLGHRPRTLRGVDPTMTVLDYLRQVEGLVGTKEGCNEGDCGACTVVRARPRAGGLHYEAINACIQFVPMLDGCQLLTVEHLADPDGTLHPIQQALVDCHGSQCGFCTPGFVMSLFAFSRTAERTPDDAAVDDALAGNLCRCTGYAPIVRAAQKAIPGPPDRFAAGAAETYRSLAAWSDDHTVEIGEDGRRFFAPADADGLAAVLLANPDATIVGGATDVGLWVTKEMRVLDTVVYTGRVADLQLVEETDVSIEIGGGASYSDAMAALARHYPDMGEVFRRLGSVPIRNTGTIGGNIANGSPIGDSAPMLIAAGATLRLRHGDVVRSIPLEDFFLDYGRQDRQPGEFVQAVSVPRPAPGSRFRAYKISKRFDQDISAVLGAFSLQLDGGRVASARIAYGGMAAIPKRATAAEAALAGARWTEETAQHAMLALAEDFRPITDWRASADYRMRAAQNLLLRLWLETTQPAIETRLAGDRSLAHV